MKPRPRSARPVRSVHPAAVAALLALASALPVSCSLRSDGLFNDGSGSSSSAGGGSSSSGDGGNILPSAVTSTASSTGSGASSTSASTSTSTSTSATSSVASSSSSGGPTSIVWHSWDVITQNNPDKMIAPDTNGMNPATVLHFQAKGAMDFHAMPDLTSFLGAAYPDAYSFAHNCWTQAAAPSLPYVCKSGVARGADPFEKNTPSPLNVEDLQVHPGPDNTPIVVAFKVPTTGMMHYALSDVAVRRVAGPGDTVIYSMYVGTDTTLMQVGPTLNTTMPSTANRTWLVDPGTYDLGNRKKDDQINFVISGGPDPNFDATEISWTLTAM